MAILLDKALWLPSFHLADSCVGGRAKKESSMKSSLALAVLLGLSMSLAASATTAVTKFASGTDKWGYTAVQNGGSASIVNLLGAGGNLESAAPLGKDAAYLVTNGTDQSKAEVGINHDFGLLKNAISTINLSYNYYKTLVPGGNASAAPTLKLGIWTGTTTQYLVYEPYWNTQGNPPTGAWQAMSINGTTGSGADGSGGWWTTGMFGQPSGAGGPPVRSLAEWNTLFMQNSSYANAVDSPTRKVAGDIVYLGIGIGTYNRSTSVYFDDVHANVNEFNETYDFQTVPEPLTMIALFGAIGAVGTYVRRRQARA